MLHHTTDPVKRVEDIAERLQEIAYRQYGPCCWPNVWVGVYNEVLPEFCHAKGPPKVDSVRKHSHPRQRILRRQSVALLPRRREGQRLLQLLSQVGMGND